MKMLTFGAMLVLCLAVSACAGTAGRNGIAKGSIDADVDVGKVVAVNQWAERRGATVVWVNYPRRDPRLRDDNG